MLIAKISFIFTFSEYSSVHFFNFGTFVIRSKDQRFNKIYFLDCTEILNDRSIQCTLFINCFLNTVQ